MSDPHKIFKYFRDVVDPKKLEAIKVDSVSRILETYGSLVKSHDYKQGLVTYIGLFSDGTTNDPVEAPVTYSFYKKYKTELSRRTKDAIDSIDKLVYKQAESSESAKMILNNFNRELYHIRLNAKKQGAPDTYLIESLQTIQSHLHERYSLEEFVVPSGNKKLSFFGFKDLITINQFRDIYEIAIKYEIIEWDVVGEDTFMEVFLENPSGPETIIYFNCTNSTVKQFIEKIRPLFTSLNPKRIGESGRFFSKQKTMLSETNYNRTRIKTTARDEAISKEIDLIINAS